MPNYDSPWKEILEGYFPDFMAFSFPTPTETSTGQRDTKVSTKNSSKSSAMPNSVNGWPTNS